MQKLSINIKGMKGQEDEKLIIGGLKQLKGVLLVNVDSDKEMGVVTFNNNQVTAEDVVNCVASLGFEVAPYEEKAGLARDNKIGVGLVIALGVLLVIYAAVRILS